MFGGGHYARAGLQRRAQLTRFGARDYDASVGRWVSKDPILFRGRQANVYVYAGDDAINRTDPTGFIAPIVGAVLAGAATGGIIGGVGYLLTHPQDCWTWNAFAGNLIGGAIAGAGAPLVGFGLAAGGGAVVGSVVVGFGTGVIGDVVRQVGEGAELDLAHSLYSGGLNLVGGSAKGAMGVEAVGSGAAAAALSAGVKHFAEGVYKGLE